LEKVLNILLIVLGIGSLALIGLMIFIGTVMGKTTHGYDFSYSEQVSYKKQNVRIGFGMDSIPQGQLLYELSFSEWDSRIDNLPVEIQITDNKITVYNSKKNPLTGGEIIIQGILLKHKSGKWIIGKSENDQNAEEIGGCSGGPVPIDFETKIIEWC